MPTHEDSWFRVARFISDYSTNSKSFGSLLMRSANSIWAGSSTQRRGELGAAQPQPKRKGSQKNGVRKMRQEERAAEGTRKAMANEIWRKRTCGGGGARQTTQP